ncbi:hypothetical protein ACFLZP_02125 [Patescibacteria group bacterium]
MAGHDAPSRYKRALAQLVLNNAEGVNPLALARAFEDVDGQRGNPDEFENAALVINYYVQTGEETIRRRR